MSKKIYTLAHSQCGYCTMLNNVVEATFKDYEKVYNYLLEDKDDDEVMIGALKGVQAQMGIRSYPFTVMVENNKVLRVLRGYDPNGIKEMMQEALAEEDTNQMEIPFPSDN